MCSHVRVCLIVCLRICLQLLYMTWPTYWVFIGQLVISFNTYCNNHPHTCCKEPNSAYRSVFRTNKALVSCILCPGTPCTEDSSSLGACRFLGQEATITVQQGVRMYVTL